MNRSGARDRVRSRVLAAIVSTAISVSVGHCAPDIEARLVQAEAIAHQALRLESDGKFEEALALQNQVIAILEEAQGPRHPNVAKALDEKGNILLQLRRLGDARSAYQRAVDILSAGKESNLAMLADRMYNLANVIRQTGSMAESVVTYEAALRLAEQANGSDSIDLIPILVNLGSALRKTAGPSKALPIHSRAMNIVEQSKSATKVGWITVAVNLAETKVGLGDLSGAQAHLVQALQICRLHQDETKQVLEPTVRAMARLLERKGESAAAISLLKEFSFPADN